jgi:hypothetical protein
MSNFKEFLNLTFDVLIRPSNAARKIKSNNFLIWVLLLILVRELLNLFTYRGILTFFNQPTSYSVLLWNLLVIFLLFPISINFAANIMGGNGKYINALQIYVIYNIPFILFSLVVVPFIIINQYWDNSNFSLILQIFSWIQVVISIWVILLIILSIKIIYQLSYWRAILTIIIHYLFILISYLLFTYFRLMLSTGFSGL